MPIIKSAQKRVRTARKATVRNLKTRRDFKTAIKSVQSKLKSGSKTVADELANAQSKLDKAVKKGVISKNKAARKKSQLAKASKKAGAKAGKTTKKAAPAKKAAVKPAVKKSAAKPKKNTAKKSSK
jgi:small subunit ribosomal protein S20